MSKFDILIADVIGDITLILIVSSLLGAVARRCGQPTVVGQILAGILMGRSALGHLPGHTASRLFPHPAIPYLNMISQIAVVIFMFGVGYELDWGALGGARRAVALVAASAMIVPMALGSGIALIFRSGFTEMGQPRASHSFVLFMGVALSVTALPVMAAITRERGIAGTTAGITATTAAGIMDVTAWLVLAATLVGTTQHASRPWPVTLLMISVFAAIMLLAARPLLLRLADRPGALLSSPLPLALILALGCAWVTSSLGLHPVFGGFLAGLTMPRVGGKPDADVLRPVEEIGGLLLPVFFVVTGLSVNIGALGGTALMMLALIFAIASGGKLVPGYFASRAGGLGRRDSATVAALVNTRGLTELIALNTGLSAGIIGVRLFSVLVLMALITTALTVPLLSAISVKEPATSAIRADRKDAQT